MRVVARVDPELRTAAKDIGMGNMDEHMRHAESMGLDWDRSDLVEFQKEVTGTEGGLADLSEEELDQVAGGRGSPPPPRVAVGVAAGAAAGAAVGGCGRSSGWEVEPQQQGGVAGNTSIGNTSMMYQP